MDTQNYQACSAGFDVFLLTLAQYPPLDSGFSQQIPSWYIEIQIFVICIYSLFSVFDQSLDQINPMVTDSKFEFHLISHPQPMHLRKIVINIKFKSIYIPTLPLCPCNLPIWPFYNNTMKAFYLMLFQDLVFKYRSINTLQLTKIVPQPH